MSDGPIGSAEELQAELVVELYVSELTRSVSFYRKLGFSVGRQVEGFAALRWGHSYLLLLEDPARARAGEPRSCSVRVVVSNVDATRDHCECLGMAFATKIGDRYYGLRDFSVLDPDGVEVRIAAPLARP